MAFVAQKCDEKGLLYVVEFNGKNTRMEIQLNPDDTQCYYESWGDVHFEYTLSKVEEANNAI